MSNYYRQHQPQTLERVVQDYQESWHEKVLRIAKELVLVMGKEQYLAWCDANKELSDEKEYFIDWQKLHGILEAKLNEELACHQLEGQDHQEQMREERPL